MLSDILKILGGAAVPSILWGLDRTLLQRPRIKGTIEDLAKRWELGSSDAAPHDALITLHVFVTNTRNVPVRIQTWTLHVTDDSGTYEGYSVLVEHVPQARIRKEFKGTSLEGLSNALPAGTLSLDQSLLETPLDRAGREGWLEFHVPGLAGKDGGTAKVTLTLLDSLNHKHKLSTNARWEQRRLYM